MTAAFVYPRGAIPFHQTVTTGRETNLAALIHDTRPDHRPDLFVALRAQAQTAAGPNHQIIPRRWAGPPLGRRLPMGVLRGYAELPKYRNRIISRRCHGARQTMKVQPQVVQHAHGMLRGQLHHDAAPRMVGETLHERCEVRHIVGDMMTDDDISNGGLACQGWPCSLDCGDCFTRPLGAFSEGAYHPGRGIDADQVAGAGRQWEGSRPRSTAHIQHRSALRQRLQCALCGWRVHCRLVVGPSCKHPGRIAPWRFRRCRQDVGWDSPRRQGLRPPLRRAHISRPS